MIRGVVAAVPSHTVKNKDARFVKATGVAERRVVDGDSILTLAHAACDVLLEGLKWDAPSVAAIIFVTQTPAFRMPATACLLADKLGMTCPAFDVNMACSGYVYGLWLASRLNGRILLVTGDVTSTVTNQSAEGTRNLFGDGVAVTGIDGDLKAFFNLGTDGSGAKHLYGDPQITMDGPEVFGFTQAVLPSLVESVTMNAHVDWFLMHQANAVMLAHLGKKCRIDPAKMPMNVGRYGNMSSASIPLLMADSECSADLKANKRRVAMFGFGAGWSFGGAMFDIGPLSVLEVVEV